MPCRRLPGINVEAGTVIAVGIRSLLMWTRASSPLTLTIMAGTRTLSPTLGILFILLIVQK
jgi:hypothetical protein